MTTSSAMNSNSFTPSSANTMEFKPTNSFTPSAPNAPI